MRNVQLVLYIFKKKKYILDIYPHLALIKMIELVINQLFEPFIINSCFQKSIARQHTNTHTLTHQHTPLYML